jgi:hypothetical protein
MAWNAHAHGDALHFVARVSGYRRAIGAADVPLADKLLGYPRALVTSSPEIAVLACVAACGLFQPTFRRLWALPLGAALATLAFLVWGDVRDGAPTHHAERALAPVWWLVAAAGVDGTRSIVSSLAWARPRREAVAVGVLTAAVAAWCLTLPSRWRDFPGASAEEMRTTQIARGLDMRARNVTHADIEPCAYEHFALLAAWGEPERASIAAPSHVLVTDACPRVREQAALPASDARR